MLLAGRDHRIFGVQVMLVSVSDWLLLVQGCFQLVLSLLLLLHLQHIIQELEAETLHNIYVQTVLILCVGYHTNKSEATSDLSLTITG